MAKLRKPEREPTRKSERIQTAKAAKQSVKNKLKGVSKAKRFCRPKQRKSCKLLQLPGEIRNHIYRFALVEGSITVKKDGPAPPALLLTSRQIRREARGIYYGENRFTIKVKDYEGAPFTNFIRQHDFATLGEPATLKILMTGQPNWTNLLAWLKEWYLTRRFRPEPAKDADDEYIWPCHQTVISMFDIVDEGPWFGWHRLEKVLEHAYKAIATKHRCWA